MSYTTKVWMALIAAATFSLVPLSLEASSLTSQNVVSEINRVRSGYNLAPLTELSKLDSAAQKKAREIALLGELEHTPTIEGVPWEPLSTVGYTYKKAGEILAANVNTAEALVAAWMGSPSHRATLLASEYTEVGIGIDRGIFRGVESNFAAGYLAIPREVEEETIEVSVVASQTKQDPQVELLQKLILLLNQLIAQYQKNLAQNVR